MVEENVKTGSDIEHVSSLKDRLHQVVDEIDALKETFSKNTENLTKIQSMLDIGSIEHITTMIEDFETVPRFNDIIKALLPFMEKQFV